MTSPALSRDPQVKNLCKLASPQDVTLLILTSKTWQSYQQPQDPDESFDLSLSPSEVKSVSVLVADMAKFGTHRDPISLQGLLRRVAEIEGVGPTIATYTLHRLFNMLESVDSLYDLIDQAKEATSKGVDSEDILLERHSILGIYVRRLVFAFESMDFRQTTGIWKAIKTYVTEYLGPVHKIPWPLSWNEVEAWLTTRQPGTQQETDSTNNIADDEAYYKRQARTLVDNQDDDRAAYAILRSQASAKSNNPLAHFINFMSCKRVKNYSEAMRNLHRFYDLRRTKDFSFHHATMNLAELHNSFGQREASLQAIHETVRIAQEHNDHDSLQQALGWLVEVGTDHAGEPLHKILVDVTEASENSAYSQSTAKLNYAKYLCGEGHDPITVLSMATKGFAIAASTESASAAIGMGYNLYAGLWDLWGFSGLSVLYSQLHLRNGKGSAPDDAFCKLAIYFEFQGESVSADSILNQAAAAFPIGTPSSAMWISVEQQLKFHRALRARNWNTAREHCHHTGNTGFPVDKLYREALLFKEQGHYAEAIAKLQHLYSALKSAEMTPSERALFCIREANAKLLEAETLHASGSNVAAMMSVLQVIATATKMHFESLRATAMLVFCDVLITLGVVPQAKKLLTEVTPQVLAHGFMEDKGKLRFLSGRIALAEEGVKGINTSVKRFQRALRCFESLKHKKLQEDTLYFLARCFSQIPGKEQDSAACVKNMMALKQ